MSTRTRPATSRQHGETERERLLLDAIADGDLDHSLHALADAVDARLTLLQTVKAASALAHLNVGDEVQLNDKVRPRYLSRARGQVVAVEERDVTIQLSRPIGRFNSGQIRCSPLALERIAPAG